MKVKNRSLTTRELNVLADDYSCKEREWDIPGLRLLINDRLSALLPHVDSELPMLRAGMSYNLLAPGKRLRPLLTLLTAQNFGYHVTSALDVACSIEMIHAASLILDDLPAMDNAVVRRGQQTTHRKFGEDIAILSGVGLLNLAFSVLAANKTLSADIRIELIRLLTGAVGFEGLIGGQVMDLHLRSASTDDHQLSRVNAQKTAVLLRLQLKPAQCWLASKIVSSLLFENLPQSWALDFKSPMIFWMILPILVKPEKIRAKIWISRQLYQKSESLTPAR